MIRKCLKGDFKGAQPAHYSMIEFTRLMFAEGSPAGVKAALKQLGVCGDTVRLPLVNISADAVEKIKTQIGLIG
jgi:4-hydroxy-tetrahydrodipicolinate synthase